MIWCLVYHFFLAHDTPFHNRHSSLFYFWKYSQIISLSIFFYLLGSFQWGSVQFSRSVMSDSLWPHGLQHTRPPCPSQLLEFSQTHVHWVGDAIQTSHPLLSPSSPTLNPSQHQGLFKWVSSSNRMAKVLEFQLHRQSFQWTLNMDLLQHGLVGSPCSPRDSQESSLTP